MRHCHRFNLFAFMIAGLPLAPTVFDQKTTIAHEAGTAIQEAVSAVDYAKDRADAATLQALTKSPKKTLLPAAEFAAIRATIARDATRKAHQKIMAAIELEILPEQIQYVSLKGVALTQLMKLQADNCYDTAITTDSHERIADACDPTSNLAKDSQNALHGMRSIVSL
jgi:hypothetical protein